MALGARFWKWMLGLGAVGGGVALVASSSTASASTGPDPGKGGKGVRAGVAYEGCQHFELVDQAPLRSWALSNLLTLQSALGTSSLDDVREDPELGAFAFFATLFPECPDYKAATFGPHRVSYDEAMAQIKAAIAGLDAAPEGDQAAAAIAELVLLAMLGSTSAPVVEPPGPGPKLPPVPQPPMDGEGASSGGDVLLLEDAEDFRNAEVLKVIDPVAGVDVEVPRTVLLGYSEGWTGNAPTRRRMEQLAAEHPDLEWVLFSFTTSRAVIGQPDATVAYVATAVDPDGHPMGEQLVSANLGAPAISDARWKVLTDYARAGYPTAPGSMVETVKHAGSAYTILLQPPQAEGDHAWSWWVWKGPRKVAKRAVAKGSSLGQDKARQHARASIIGLG